MSTHLFQLPQFKPLGARKSAIVSVLDVGTTKIACVIAKLIPMEASKTLRGRTHAVKILGLGLQRARGIKAGMVMDVASAEQSIRHAVHAAERMAGVTVAKVIVGVTGGRLAAKAAHGEIVLNQRAVDSHDMADVLYQATKPHMTQASRLLLHALPTQFSLDEMGGITDPHGMIGTRLGVDLRLISTEPSSLRNLILTVERCHLEVEGLVATPYASALSCLVDDEADLGTVVVDCGGGATSMAVFKHGALVHVDAVAVGGHHITMDIARGLMVSVPDAERAKTLFGAAVASSADERDTIPISHIGEKRGLPNYVPRAQLIRIIRPRVEETLELVRDRLTAAGFAEEARRRLVVTGGASQLSGFCDMAGQIMSHQVRLGRPVGVRGLPESGKTPAFAAAIGLLVYPQFAGREYRHVTSVLPNFGLAQNGYIAKVGRWLQESF